MIRYKDLSAKQVSSICNGCGGKGGWVKPPRRRFFVEQCNQHDFNYFLGFIEAHRKKADKQLKKAMHQRISLYGMPWYKKILHPWCHAYYLAVRLAGKKYFYYGKQEQEVPNI